MHHLLQHDKDHISEILNSATQIAEAYFSNQAAYPVSLALKPMVFDDLPEQGTGAIQVLEHFRQHYASLMNNSAGADYFGFVTGGSTPASVAGDWLVSAFDQNACGYNDSVAPQLEHQTTHFFKQLFGLDDAYFGTFVTGATMSNFVSLALGRQWAGEQLGIDFSNDGLTGYAPLKVLSGTPHSSIIKSLSMTGVGRNAMIRINTLPAREAIDIQALETYLKENKGPFIVVANAGTVNTVDFDDLEALGQLKCIYHFWLHVDAAFGGFAACSEKYAHYMKGINYADSVTIDAHKWLNVPYDAAMQFTRHKELQLKVFQNSAAYLGDPDQSPDFFHYTPENSRRFRALPSWFSLMAYGKTGHREIVERNCDAAHNLGEKIKQSDTFILLAPVRMNIVCFTLKRPHVSMGDVHKLLAAIRDDGRVFFTPTVYKGVPAIRAAISNWQTEVGTMEYVFSILQKILNTIDF